MNLPNRTIEIKRIEPTRHQQDMIRAIAILDKMKTNDVFIENFNWWRIILNSFCQLVRGKQ